MYVLWRIIVKEFLQLRHDRRMIPIIFVAPVLQLVLFGFAVNTDVSRVPTVLVDQDRTAASRALVERFTSSGYFELVGVEDTPAGIDDWLVSGRAQVALVIGPGYARALAGGGVPQVQVIADGSDSSPATVALGYGAGIVSAASREAMVDRLRDWVARAAREGRAVSAPGQTVLVPRVWYNPDLKSRWFYVPAVLAMILMIMTMLLSAMGVVREKEIGTMEQIMVTPIRSWQLIVGKLSPFAVIGLIQVFLVTGVAVFGFGVPLRGSFPLLVALSQLFVLNTLGLGLLVSTLVRTQQQAMMLAAFTVMLPMVYLSGLIFPIENMPPAVQYITYAIPVRYYATIIRGVFLRGSGIDVLWPQALTLFVMGTSILGVAALRFRKRLD
ncbi:MAG TPA: ABC transporter permease [Vicinamibacteria bacterium]|nr:ABC transporter permease [Vicinamibacteria bacterium]